jgi:hypothetical protein
MCGDTTCSDQAYGRNVQSLAAGTYCIVAAQTGTVTSGKLRVFPINGSAIVASASGSASSTTCGHPANFATPSCFTPVGPSLPMLFWQCPNKSLQFVATAVPEADLAIGLTLRDATDNGEQSNTCALGTTGGSAQVHGTFPSPGPYWLMIDGAGGGGSMQCGTVSVTFSID